MAIATLVYTTPYRHKSDAAQIAAFGTSQIFEPDAAGNAPFNELMGLPSPPVAGVTDTTVVVAGPPKVVQRTIAYDLANPALATFVSRFPTVTAQKSALQALFQRRLEAVTGCEVTVAAVTVV